jgi:hypothetical protein
MLDSLWQISDATRRLAAAGAKPTCRPQLFMTVVLEHQRAQRRQPRQGGGQRAVVAIPDTPQLQARQAAEPRPILQLHAFEQPAPQLVGLVQAMVVWLQGAFRAPQLQRCRRRPHSI